MQLAVSPERIDEFDAVLGTRDLASRLPLQVMTCGAPG
jgi:hypothetical protein